MKVSFGQARILAVAAFGGVALAAVEVAPASALVIDTTGGANGSAIFDFGAPNTATYGQTFTVSTSDNVLGSFSLFLSQRFAGSGTLNLQGFVAGWNGVEATNLLFTGGVQTMNAAGSLQEFAYNTGGIQLQTGQKYVAFLSISDLGAQAESSFGMPETNDTSAGGNFVFQDDLGGGFNALFTSSWAQFHSNNVEFKADLEAPVAAVPEPASLALFGAGLAGLGLFRRRKRA